MENADSADTYRSLNPLYSLKQLFLRQPARRAYLCPFVSLALALKLHFWQEQ